jgi:YbbR domain-containing protein
MGRFRDAILNDLWIKLFSLAFAIFLWVSIVGGESGEEVFVVPLTITNIPENMIISNNVVDYVNVRVRGRRGALRSLNSKQINVSLDLKDAKEGENNITIFPEEISLPEGVSAVRVSPSIFKIQLERLTEKWLTVVPSFMGAPAQGYKVGKVEVSPTKVPVTGLRDALLGESEIETRYIELFGKDKTFTEEAELKPINGNVHIKGNQKVKVTVEIVVKTVERTFRNIAVKVAGLSQEVAINPTKVTVTVSGPEMDMDGLLPSSIRVSLPEQTKEGTFHRTPQVLLPKGFQVVKVSPKTIQVKVKKTKPGRK